MFTRNVPHRESCDNSRSPAEEGQVHRQDTQAMKKAKHNNAKKHSKEYAEKLWISENKDNHAKEGTESFIRQKRKLLEEFITYPVLVNLEVVQIMHRQYLKKRFNCKSYS